MRKLLILFGLILFTSCSTLERTSSYTTQYQVGYNTYDDDYWMMDWRWRNYGYIYTFHQPFWYGFNYNFYWGSLGYYNYWYNPWYNPYQWGYWNTYRPTYTLRTRPQTTSYTPRRGRSNVEYSNNRPTNRPTTYRNRVRTNTTYRPTPSRPTNIQSRPTRPTNVRVRPTNPTPEVNRSVRSNNTTRKRGT